MVTRSGNQGLINTWTGFSHFFIKLFQSELSFGIFWNNRSERAWIVYRVVWNDCLSRWIWRSVFCFFNFWSWGNGFGSGYSFLFPRLKASMTSSWSKITRLIWYEQKWFWLELLKHNNKPTLSGSVWVHMKILNYCVTSHNYEFLTF